MKLNFGTAHLPGLFELGISLKVLALAHFPTAHLPALARANIQTLHDFANRSEENIKKRLFLSPSVLWPQRALQEARLNLKTPLDKQSLRRNVIVRAAKAGVPIQITVARLGMLREEVEDILAAEKSDYIRPVFGQKSGPKPRHTDLEIIAAVDAHATQREAARFLGISDCTLSTRLKKIDRSALAFDDTTKPSYVVSLDDDIRNTLQENEMNVRSAAIICMVSLAKAQSVQDSIKGTHRRRRHQAPKAVHP